MKILAIDTSCDDTSIAVVEKKNNQIKVISNVVSSQIQIHAPYGGVYPMLAKREHQNNLALTTEKALKRSGLARLNFQFSIFNFQSNPKLKTLKKLLIRDELLLENTEKLLLKYKKPKVDAIAITNTPGLEPCLWQGVNFAKALSFWWNLPIIPVNHIKAHLAANWLSKPPSGFDGRSHSVAFPAIGLVASGGHTELIYMPKQGVYKIVGSTRDDAAGECFDKTARILGLPYPGGPAIAALAAKKESGIKNQELRITLPRPMLSSKDFDFSFSGLKTAVLYNFQSQKKDTQESESYKIAMAHEIQQAIIDVLISKTLKATNHFKVKSIITGGGVMANKELRKQFKLKIKNLELKIPFFVPEKSLCMDNAAMVGAEALLNWSSKDTHSISKFSWKNIQANGNLDI